MKCESCEHENVDGARFCAKCGAILPTPEPTGDDPLIGEIVGGRYRITRVLGEGGMGIVYGAEQQMGSTVRTVAVKTLHAHLSKDPSVLARFHRECGTVAQLEHPNTIKFYDFGSMPDGTLYIAMEFVKGDPMDKVIERGPMAPGRVLKVMKQICGALDEAHKLGIVHRDLKPENVILTDRAGEPDFAKVLDFGIAARQESADAQKEAKLTQQGMVLGTPPYMSPEQFTGKELDHRSDIYSLGVMSYEMLTGKLPFEADTPWEWATKHMTAQPTPFEATPESVRAPDLMRGAIMRSLLKDKEERQDSVLQFYEELSGGGGITVEQPPQSDLAVAAGSAGTAAMAAAPNFAAPPAAAPVGPAPMAAPAMAPAAVLPPNPGRPAGGQDSGGGGKGLIIGLMAVGGLLLVGIVIAVVASGDPSGAPPPPADTSDGGGLFGGGPKTPIAPTDPPAAELDSGGSGDTDPPPIANTGTGTKKPPTGSGSSGGGVVPKKKVPVGDACAKCISAAGYPPAAQAFYNQCTDGGKKAQCQSAVRRSAIGAATTASRNGKCGQARSIKAAADGMGAGSGGLNAAVARCK